MKVLVLENSLDDLLNVKISVNGGQSYTDYNVSSLKNGGLTLDCNPSDIKVICDTNILNYIKVFADGEKLNTGSSQTTIKELSVTENGTYNAESNAAYNPVIVNVPSGGEDKLLCYFIHVVNLEDGRPIFVYVIYTDKPATKISAGEIGGVEQSFYPADDGKHLFMINVNLSNYQGSSHFVNLIYEDGSPATDLKDKFVYAP